MCYCSAENGHSDDGTFTRGGITEQAKQTQGPKGSEAQQPPSDVTVPLLLFESQRTTWRGIKKLKEAEDYYE